MARLGFSRRGGLMKFPHVSFQVKADVICRCHRALEHQFVTWNGSQTGIVRWDGPSDKRDHPEMTPGVRGRRCKRMGVSNHGGRQPMCRPDSGVFSRKWLQA